MKIAVTGANGQLGMAFAKYLEQQKISFKAFGKEDWNICSTEDSNKWLSDHRFDVLVNCAAYTDVEKAESDVEACYAINAEGPKILAETCSQTHTTLIHFSTDYVFDGTKETPYLEDDATNPINVYGSSKLLGETNIRDASCHHLIFRISWLFGGKNAGFLHKVNQWMKNNNTLSITADEFSSPTYCHHVPEAVISVLRQGTTASTFHLSNQGSCSRFDWVKYYVQECLHASTLIQPASSASFKTKAKRPQNSSLGISKIVPLLRIQLPTWQEATKAYTNALHDTLGG